MKLLRIPPSFEMSVVILASRIFYADFAHIGAFSEPKRMWSWPLNGKIVTKQESGTLNIGAVGPMYLNQVPEEF